MWAPPLILRFYLAASIILVPSLVVGSSLTPPTFSVPADLHNSNFPWGSTNIGSRSCPIRYPWANETNFCLSVGRQRAIVNVTANSASGNIACVKIQWRLRSDIPTVEEICVFVTTPNANFTPAIKSGDRIQGEVCFETIENITTYAVYYLPIAYAVDLGTGSYHSHFLTTTMLPTQFNLDCINADCINTKSNHGLRHNLRESISTIPAQLVRFESQSSHDARSPLEFAASDDEVKRLLDRYPSSPYLAWVSLIENTTDQTVRMNADLPFHLIQSPPNNTVSVSLDDGVVRAVQVILYAARKPIRGVAVDILTESSLQTGIDISCLQTTGTNYRGEDMVPPRVELQVGQVGHLLFLISEAKLDDNRGHAWLSNNQTRLVRVKPKGSTATTFAFYVTSSTSSNALAEQGMTLSRERQKRRIQQSQSSDVWRLSRLSWLNSRTGLDEAEITRPYTPIEYAASPDGAQWFFQCRGRTITICSKTGLPMAITSNGREVLASPISFRVAASKHESSVLEFVPQNNAYVRPIIVLGPSNSSAWWSIPLTSLGGDVNAQVSCVMTYDGHLDISIALSSSSGTMMKLEDASLVINVENDIARFAVGGGFGDDGDWFPKNASLLDWSWRDSSSGWRLWLGDVDAGLYMKIKGVEDAWNEANPVEAQRPLSWAGASGVSGGIHISKQQSSVLITAYSGPIDIRASPLLFNFSIVSTPTKGDYIHTNEGKQEHYKLTRHFHVPYGQWDPPDPCRIFNNTTLPRPTTLILHQSNRLNPYINWPFHPNIVPELSVYVRRARSCGVAVKIYYTVHELTNHCVELHALMGLNGEVLLRRSSDRPPLPGPGYLPSSGSSTIRRKLGQGGDLKGNEWLLEHVTTGYQGAWFTQNPSCEEDAAVFDNVTSRFLNYYIQGQRWLYNNVGIDGIYYDGFNSERRVQQRIRRMSKLRSNVKPDSSEDEVQTIRFDVHGRPFDYAELLPFVDSMWTCEGIDFTKNPAYWLVSISALPFGVFGEMLGSDRVHPVPGHFCGESCANKWRGMLFGMTNRAGWNGKDPNDNLHLWKLWDDVEIDKASMYGWWNQSCPVRVLEPDGSSHQASQTILSTAYVKPGNLTLVAVASWDASNKTVALEIDWDGLGLSKGGRRAVTAPLLPSYNRANRTLLFHSDKSGLVRISVPAYEGWLLVLS